MTTKTYTVTEAKKRLSKLIREAERGDEVYIVDEKKRRVKVVPLGADKKRKPGGFEGKISSTPDAFDPLTDEELKDWGLK